jgi:hypothetical protein
VSLLAAHLTVENHVALLDEATHRSKREVEEIVARLATTNRPRPNNGATPRSRLVPAAVRRRVWERDGGQCAFVSASGHRCTERGRLEFHHVVPYAKGGDATVENIQLRCRCHNGYEAERDFGPWSATHAREERALYGATSVGETSPRRMENRRNSASRPLGGAPSRRSAARPGGSRAVHKKTSSAAASLRQNVVFDCG